VKAKQNPSNERSPAQGHPVGLTLPPVEIRYLIMSHDEPMSETNGDRLPIDPELISAFFDGEITPEERAAVEESMEDGGGTLQMLDDFDQLSQSLKQLHRSAGSPDVKANVMRQIRPPARVAAPAMSKPRRRMLSVVAGLTGMAAAVTLLMWPLDNAQHANMLAVNDNEHEFTAAGSVEAMSAGSELQPPAAGRGESSAAVRGMRSSAAPAATSPPEMAAMAELEAGVHSTLVELASERPLPEVGDVLGYMDQNADELTWVAVTVVDVQTAGDQVQLLLTRNGVESPAPDESVSDSDSPTSPEDRMTFLVEADWDQMESVIVDLTDSQFVNSLSVSAPHEDGVPKELQDYHIERRGDPTVDEYALSANRLAQELKQRVQSRPRPATERDASIAQTPTGQRNDAVQLQMLMPDEDLKRIAARRGVESQLAATPQADAPREGPTVEPETAGQAEQPPREVEPGRIGLPLASRRAKVVIVIQAQNR
jgi:hypothetical protein